MTWAAARIERGFSVANSLQAAEIDAVIGI
jgi:hypothetical protein